ncbi:putative nucleoside triphosphate pyrophosphohydrolase [Aeromonas phage phiA8-29]|uniref:Putative nucleoside triphosphate pyrophosphohydrolase n=1 Tax=Aeromonas phage phiA8-29 TaxID=1978922 RepID=A0A1W6DYL1_9CAUD|nr:nucleotide pyrophosphohydrolase [Aeromonas phage phiA8-29]ARK07995.1 putative nucleoside triphosphate pyrophosphohydrolase [Aeromonas phage phiA8-29]
MQNSSIATTLKMVADLNRCFGNEPWYEIRGEEPPRFHTYLNGQVSLIIEEMYEELHLAESQEDIAGMLDAIGDSITVIDGLAHKAGFFKHDLGRFDIATDCLAFGALRDSVQLYNIKNFGKIPHFISDNEVSQIAFELWASHRAFIEAYSIQKGFDPLKVYEEVHESNMSKFCNTVEEAHQSLMKYFNQYGLVSAATDSFARDVTSFTEDDDLRVEEVNGVYVIKTNREVKMGEKVVKAGKFLKGINFKEPDFSNPGRFELARLVAPVL